MKSLCIIFRVLDTALLNFESLMLQNTQELHFSVMEMGKQKEIFYTACL